MVKKDLFRVYGDMKEAIKNLKNLNRPSKILIYLKNNTIYCLKCKNNTDSKSSKGAKTNKLKIGVDMSSSAKIDNKKQIS